MFKAFNNKKDRTLEECEKIEAEKIEENRLLTDEIKALTTKNEDLLIGISFGDKAAEEEFSRNELRIAEFSKKKRANKAFLDKVLPDQKNRARALKIEALIPEIEKLDARFSAFVADINKKAAALAESNNSFRKFLGDFDGFEAIRMLGLQGEFVSFGLGGMSRNSPPSAAAYSDPKSIDLTIVLMAAVYDKDRFAAWVEKTRSLIAERIMRMHDHALRLKGQDLPKPTYPYCPNCYQTIGYPDKEGRSQCNCGKGRVVPVY